MSSLKIMMCGHTGGRNRGCEAIVRTTAKLLIDVGIDSEAMTFDIEGDKNVELDRVVKLKEYPKKKIWDRGFSLLHRIVFHNAVWGSSFYHKKVITNQREYNLIFNVGGDTYCYGMPWISIAMNRLAKEKNCPTVFWGCSVDNSLGDSEELIKDINNYDFIVSRETYSYEILKRYYKNLAHLKLACDPAFHLEAIETELPKGFQVNNTIGINISPVMVDVDNIEESMVYKNVLYLIDCILKNTDMSICLIPHVYQVKPESRDFIVLKHIYKKYRESARVSFVRKELMAGELKYIISKCRFFVGSRTHSVIAAYSSAVPAIALSYSIKSRGLAHDIMGTEEGYAIAWNSLTNKAMLSEAFDKYLLQEESKLKKHLVQFIPYYKQSILDVVEELKNEYENK